MAETVSTRLPPKIIKMMEEEAKAKGITLSSLLREIIEEHYGIEISMQEQKSFLLNLQETIEKLGKAKMSSCNRKENCPLKQIGFEPSPLNCAVCQIHNHALGLLETGIFNPYIKE